MANQTVIKLQDGNVMPQLGLGVWKAGNDEVVSAIHKALEVGYRSIDTAAAYKNEDGVGKALASAGVPRDEFFITTKLWNDDQKRPREALEESLEKLQLDFVDLYLMHWPVPAIDHYVDAWKGMIELQKEGLVKSIGVCNFQVHHLQRLIDETGVVPVSNQIELHPYLQNRKVVEFAQSKGIHITSYMTLAYGKVLQDPVLGKIAKQHGASTAQVALAWAMQLGFLVIPSSTKRVNLESNLQAQKLQLTEDDMAQIAALERDGREVNPKALAPVWD